MDLAPDRTPGHAQARASDRSASRVLGFDGLRALALIAVFLQHYTVFGRVNSTGGYGVWLFFTLSGFLIVRILSDERRRVETHRASPAAALRRFFWRRTLRIMPIYYLVLIVFTVLAVLGWARDFTWAAAPWHYLYLSNIYFADVAGRWVGRFGHFWSLAIEEQFYLLAAPALLLTPSRLAGRLCLAVVAAAAVWDLWLRSENASDMVLYANSLTNFGALAFGGWMGLRLPAAPGRGAASWPIVLLVAVLVGLVLGFPHIGLFTPGVALLVAALPFWTTALTAGLLLLAVHRNQASHAVKLLEWGPIAGFGRISYGFYLYHNLIPHWLIVGFAHRHGLAWRVPVEVETAFSFLLALGLAVVSWVLVERPLLRLKDSPPDLRRLPAAVRARLKGLQAAPAAAGEP